jgi:hypothetical protein
MIQDQKEWCNGIYPYLPGEISLAGYRIGKGIGSTIQYGLKTTTNSIIIRKHLYSNYRMQNHMGIIQTGFIDLPLSLFQDDTVTQE